MIVPMRSLVLFGFPCNSMVETTILQVPVLSQKFPASGNTVFLRSPWKYVWVFLVVTMVGGSLGIGIWWVGVRGADHLQCVGWPYIIKICSTTNINRSLWQAGCA